MSYGVTIQNVDGRIQIDENYSNMYKYSTGSATTTTAWPPTGYSNGDLVLTRAKSSGHVGKGSSASGVQFWSTVTAGTIFYTPPSSGYEWILARKIAGNISPATSGYGLEVLNSSGQLTFSATGVSSTFRVIAAGVFGNTHGDSNGEYELPFPSATGTYSDLTKIFCVTNNCTHFRLYAPEFGLNLEWAMAYRYEFTSGNAGRIHVCNKYRDGTTEYPLGNVGTYIILELVE